jgi:HD superfamily phosphohydrolase
LNKKKIINDPIYGFVTIPYDLVFDLIEHPFFQRLRRIKQLGLTNLVFPGALHTRFQHAIGAMSLANEAVENLRFKGIEITEEEAEAVCVATLLHDIGHGPFSHSLEKSIVLDVAHEEISLAFMQLLDREMDGKLSMAISIFRNKYKKKFLHQMVSSQLDMDRLDYLRRDSFYTGVTEGVVSSERIIKMLHVKNDDLVVEEKGIYSIEKFIIARRLMYWQVYLHKTVIAAETLLVNIIRRARQLASAGTEMFATPALHYFLFRQPDTSKFFSEESNLLLFSKLDDFDIFASIKVWTEHEDRVLALLCSNLINRNLPKIIIQNEKVDELMIAQKKKEVIKRFSISEEDADYFVYSDSVTNNAYNPEGVKINILKKDQRITDIADASDQYNITALSKSVVKHFLCFPGDY